MFEGNDDDDVPKKNELDYPIVARYIKFNPQRWHRFISLRVEVYGCRFGELTYLIYQFGNERINFLL